MKISKQALELVGVTVDEYIFWCRENGHPACSEKTKVLFFASIREGKIVRDKRNKRLINKYPRQEVEGEKNERNED